MGYRDAEVDRASLCARNGLQEAVQQDTEPLLWAAEAVHVLDNSVDALQHTQLCDDVALVRAWQDRGRKMPLDHQLLLWF
jgi:hypothetical protein